MNAERVFIVLVAPHFSEKSSNGGETNQFTFKVAPDATKPEIKEAVEELFKVDVESVQTLNVKGKTKRFRGVPGRRSDFKKAIVTLAEGQSVDITTGL